MSVLHTWHEVARTRNVAGLDALLADEVVFHSPVVHTPQVGKMIARLYLGAEFKVMIRPLKAINLIHQKMAAMLQK
jgi:hypothetical protein